MKSHVGFFSLFLLLVIAIDGVGTFDETDVSLEFESIVRFFSSRSLSNRGIGKAGLWRHFVWLRLSRSTLLLASQIDKLTQSTSRLRGLASLLLTTLFELVCKLVDRCLRVIFGHFSTILDIQIGVCVVSSLISRVEDFGSGSHVRGSGDCWSG